jgi:hypothetical protein
MSEVAHLNTGLISAFSLLALLTVLGVDSVIIWLLLRPARDTREGYRLAQKRELITNELGVPEARMLATPPLSVTEHTTRTLDPVHGQQQAE